MGIAYWMPGGCEDFFIGFLWDGCGARAGSTAARRDRLVEQFILQDQISPGEDQLCVESNRKLAAAASELCATCERRANMRDTMISTFRVTWRLTNDNSPNRPQVNMEENQNGERKMVRLGRKGQMPSALRRC